MNTIFNTLASRSRQLDHFSRALNRRLSTHQRLLAAMVVVLSVCCAVPSYAAIVVRSGANDGFGASGFNSATGWVGGIAPDPNDDFVAQNWDVRTANITGNETFAGNSLILTDGAALVYKGGDNHIVTINNFTIDAGVIRDTPNAGTGFTLAGNGVHLTSNGGIIWNGLGGGAGTTVSANIDGSGPLALGGGPVTTNTLSGTNTYTGPTLLLGGTITLSGPGAIPIGNVLRFGSASPTAANGNATLNLNGGSYTIGGLSIASFNSVTANGTQLNPNTNSGAGKVMIHFATLPAGIQIGQLVNRTGVGNNFISGIDYSTNNVIFGDTGPITTSGSFTFTSTSAGSGNQNQIITNTNTTTPSTLTFAGGSTASVFDGIITQAAGASTALTVSSGSLTLQRASGYTGATTLTGGTLNLNFNSSGSPANNVINASSALVLAGGTLALNSTTSSTTTADLQTFVSTSLSGSSTVQLTANFQGNNNANPRNSIALNLGAITRTTGTLDVTNPGGTLSATNGVLTTSGTASQLLTDASGAAYVTVGGVDWGATDASNAFIVALPSGSYTSSTATSLSGNADVVGNVALSGSTSVSTLRFNSGSRTVSGGTLATGGILMTTGSGASAINGGILMGTSGGNLTIIQYNTGSNLSIGSAISDNGSATALNKSGAGAVVLSGANNYTGATNVLGGTLQFAKQVALYNNNNGSWTTPGNINVSNGATLAINVGGTGEFTATDVGTLAGLSGFQSGSTLAIDTTNASGNVTLSSAIANPNGGANALGLTKLGSGVVILGAANTYTGPTTVNGGTLQLGASGAGSVSSATPVVLANVAGATFDLNGNNATVKSLSGGGSTGGKVALGAGNLAIGGGGNSTFAGAVTGTGGVAVLNGSSQSFTGAPGYSGGTTVNTGTLSLSPSGSSTVGSVTSNVTIAPNNLDNGTLNVSAGVTLNANTILVGSVDTSATSGGHGTLTQTGGAINANTLFLGGAGPYTITNTNPATGTLNLFGGTLTVPAISTAGGTMAAINFNGGTLRATTGSNPSTFIGPNIGNNNLNVQAGGANIDTNGNTFAMSNNFVHDPTAPATEGGFNKAGTGTLTLSGTNTYTGVTAVSGGTLMVQAANTASSGYAVNASSAILDLSSLGTVSLATGKTLQGIGTVITTGISHTAGTITGGVSGTPNSMGTLTLSSGNLDLAGGTVRFDLSNSSAGTNDKIVANAGLTASAASIIDVEFAAFPSTSQTYRLFDYTGSSVSSSAANFVLGGNGGRGVTLNFSTLGQVNLNFVPGNPSANLIWSKTGAAPQSWDIQTTQSWNNTTQSILHDVFFNGDNVTFDNTSGVQTSVSIPNAVAVAPGSMTVNSSTNNFSISSPGTGRITGSTSLVKSGSSTLTIATSNDYQGGTTINDNGKIIALDVGSTGVASATGSGAVTVTANAALQIGDGVTSGAGTVTGPVHNSGSVIVNRPDLFALNTPMDGTGTVTIQGGSTVQVNGTLTQTGNTVISNGTLQANGTNTLPSSSTIVLANSASAILDFNGSAQAVGALEGGGATGGTVNASGNVTIAGGPGTHNFQGTFNGPTASITVDGPGGGPTQILSGSIAYSGNTTVNNGALTLSPSADTAIGTAGTTANIGINPSNVGTLTIGPHMTFTSGTIYVGSRADQTATNGQGTLIQTGGDIETNSLLLVGTNNAVGTANVILNGGITNVYTSGITMSINPGVNNSASSASVTVNSGATLNVVNSNITIGQFFNSPGTISVNGGNLTMASDNTGTPNPSGQIQFRNNNATNLGTYTVNLNRGVLTAAAIGINITADGAGGNFNVNEARRPTINFNGGTLRTAATSTDFFSPSLGAFGATRAAGGNPIAVNIMDNGGTIDTFGNTVGFSTVLAHAGTAAVDGGLTLKDSSLTPGMLTLNAVSTYNGPTKIVSGTLQLGIANAINSASTIRMAGGVLSMNNFGQQAGGLKTTAASTIDMTTGNTGEILQFADGTALHWVNGTTASGATLHIANWTGNASTGGGLDQILFPSTTALTGNQLNQIVFDGSGFTHAQLISVGGGAELVPTNTAPTGILKFGDINQDGVVNAADIPAFLTALTDLNHYKTLHSFNDVQMATVADTNYDDVVTNADIQSLLDLVASGGGGAAAAVPEPSSCLLLGLGGFIVVLRRRKKKSSTLRG